ncbi:hypothetical protein P3102_33930 [Amycolatopsis sp. QT-25]|uniref:hypothetical protein n=1 Tax=Amycolatopsis sp. QT-25 TaxID=3034022 RepID=UPI0023ECA1E9|nr:hypothetical protein [Amycolatopsis sp. QT-25]WET78983.1 hypothetical protein P3102_33930 [Amycolatopsis sp. QT-25]
MAVLRSWIGRADRTLIAPGAAPVERLLGYGAAVFGAVFAGALAVAEALPALPAIILVVVGFDLFGGAVVNATPSGSRRFHASGPPRWSALGFVAAHIHTLILAIVLPGMPWATAIAAYAGTVLAAVFVLLAPDAFRQPVAFASAVTVLAVCTAVLPPSAVMAWVVPLLVIKLLLSHLLPHPAHSAFEVRANP